MEIATEAKHAPLSGPWIGPLLLIAYLVAAGLGLALALPATNASPFWPPAGLAFAALYVHGLRYWPAILLGAFVSSTVYLLQLDVEPHRIPLAAACIGSGNTLEATAGVIWLKRFLGKKFPFDSLRGLSLFFLLPVFSASAIGATVSMISMPLAGLGHHPYQWLVWWLGDASGALTIAPLLMLWWCNRWRISLPPRWLEFGLMLTLLFLSTLVIFEFWPITRGEHYPLAFCLLPFAVWAVLRFGLLGAALTVFLISLLAVYATVHDIGPFASGNANEALLLLQLFIAVLAGTAFSLNAVFTERNRLSRQLAASSAELQQLAFHDPLTGLLNRRLFDDRLDQTVQSALRHQTMAALLFLDLDEFKRINDSLGHKIGDELLKTIAQRLEKSIRHEDSVCRLGGDEFLILLREVEHREAARVAAHKIIDALRQPIHIAGLDIRITASLGITLIPQDGTQKDALFRQADDAMYQAKQGGRNNFRFWSD